MWIFERVGRVVWLTLADLAGQVFSVRGLTWVGIIAALCVFTVLMCRGIDKSEFE